MKKILLSDNSPQAVKRAPSKARKVLLLFDKNYGHQKQLVALAEALAAIMPIDYEMVAPGYSWLAKWPPLSRQPWFSGLKGFSLQLDRVDVILSAGHRTARPALFLKKRLAAGVAVHLLSPNGGGRFFDLLVRPNHEVRQKKSQKNLADNSAGLPANLVATVGGLSKWDSDNLAAMRPLALATAKQKIPGFNDKKTSIGVLLGGNSRLQVFRQKTGQKLLAELKQLAADHFVFVTPSARTPRFFQALLQKELPFYSRVWVDDGRDPNVYGMILSLADTIIATNDSVNMVSEGALAGKKLLLWAVPFRNPLALSWQVKKYLRHRRFLAMMKKNFGAVDYDKNQVAKANGRPQPGIINSQMVAREIKKRFFS